VRSWLLLYTAAAACALFAPALAGAETIGVIIVPTKGTDQLLADNLTEVALARIAETPGRTLAGTLELRRRLGDEAGDDVIACLEQAACLGRVGVTLGVTRLVTGAVRDQEGRFFLTLTLTDIAAGRAPVRFFRQVDGQIADLARAVQEGVDELLDPRRAPGRLRVRSEPEGARVTVDQVYIGTTPLLSGALKPGRHSVRVEMDRRFAWSSVVDLAPGRELDLALGERELPPRRLWAPYAAYGTAAGAVACAAAGAVLGSLARGAPVGPSREDAQLDLERRKTYGQLGTSLLVSSAVLAVASTVLFSRYWRDITGD
jgi:hypothetical protein